MWIIQRMHAGFHIKTPENERTNISVKSGGSFKKKYSETVCSPYLNLPMAAHVLCALLPFDLDLFSHLFSLFDLLCN